MASDDALGQRPFTKLDESGDLRSLVLRQVLWLALGGVAMGVVGALGTTRYLRGLLYGVGPMDWVTFANVSVLLTIAALAASYLPAHRATRADPISALRME